MDDVVSIKNFSPIWNEVSALETYPPHLKNIYQWPGPTAYIIADSKNKQEKGCIYKLSF